MEAKHNWDSIIEVDAVTVTVDLNCGARLVGELIFADRDEIFLDTHNGWSPLTIHTEEIKNIHVGTAGGNDEPGSYSALRVEAIRLAVTR